MYLFNPLLKTIKIYNAEYFANDLTAAITVAVVAIPQSIAFAILANISPVYGLYSAIIGTIIISILSSSNHIIGGPTNATCLLIAGSLTAYTSLNPNEYMFIVFQFTFLIGLFQMIFGIFNLGKILNYISYSVIEGFTLGAAVLIILGQANKIVGIKLPNDLMPFQKLFYLMSNLNLLNYYEILISIITIFIILLAKKIHKLAPSQIIAMLITGIIVYLFNLQDSGVRIVGTTSISLPNFKLFNLNYKDFIKLIPISFSYALIALVSTMAITKTIARNTHEKIENNREFIAQGLTNIIGAFFQSFAGAGSVSRTALNYYAGAKTRISGILSGVIIAIFLVFFGKFISLIPNASLATIIILTAFKMIDFKKLIQYYRSSKKDFIVALITLFAVIFMPNLDKAVLIGAGTSVFLHLLESGNANILILHYVAYNDSFKEISLENIKDDETILAVLLEGNLYFGLAYDLDEKLSLISDKSQNYILRFSRVNSMDITAYEIILDFTKKVLGKGNHIKLSGVNEKLYAFLEKNNYFEHIDKKDVFISKSDVLSSFDLAIEKIKTELLINN